MQFPSLLGHVEQLLGIVQNSRLPADSLIDSFFRSRKYLGSHDRRFIAETLYGTLRHMTKCEALVAKALGPGQELSDQDRRLWTVAAYLAAIENYKEISAAALETKTQSAEVRARAAEILEGLRVPLIVPDDPVQRIASEYSFPEWMVARLAEDFGPTETEQLCGILNTPAPLSLRVNLLKTDVESCQTALKEEGIETIRTLLSPAGLQVPRRRNLFQTETFRKGFFEVQDEGSQLLPLFLDPKPTAKVLDACAGAGGKTLQFAALMQNRGEIYAADINAVRLDGLRKRSRRAGAFNVRALSTENLLDRSEELKQFFDIVFIDAPCTGLGTLRRNPGMKWSVTEQSVAELALKQTEILAVHAPFVKPGGLLSYATCSFLKHENEDVVWKFLRDHPDFSLLDSADYAKKTGLERFVQNRFFRLWPHRDNTDGFFCAVLQRNQSADNS
jgi:16S rRNA (cytosine967-C5)-methyltransferase